MTGVDTVDLHWEVFPTAVIHQTDKSTVGQVMPALPVQVRLGYRLVQNISRVDSMREVSCWCHTYLRVR